MNNERDLHISYFDPQPSGSENDKLSVYSLQDGSCNFDSNIAKIKSEYQHFNKHFINDQLDEEKINNGFLKMENTMFSMSQVEIESFVSKKRQLFKCSQCPKVFSNSSAIAKHKLTHSDERKYVCEICNKAFKRQDHLNGHKHTHKANKPHACHLCERSYSDARSLRRHYENQHQDEFLRCKEHKVGRDSGGSSVDDCGSAGEVFGLIDETKAIRCEVCSKAFKNQSALNGHMRLHGGYGLTNSGITGPGEERPLPQLTAYSPTRSEDVASTAPHLSPVPCTSKRPDKEPSDSLGSDIPRTKLYSLLAKTPMPLSVTNTAKHDPQVQDEFERIYEEQSLSTLASAILTTTNQSRLKMDDLCLRLSPSATTNHPQRQTTNPLTIDSNTIHNIEYITTDHDLSVENHYSPITPAYPNQMSSSEHTTSHMFNYPSFANSGCVIFDGANHGDQYEYHWNHPNNPTYPSAKSTEAEKPWSYVTQSMTVDSNVSVVPSNPLPDMILQDADNNLGMDWDNHSDDNDGQNLVIAEEEFSGAEFPTKKDIPGEEVVDESNSCPSATSNCLFQQSPITDITMPVPIKKVKNRPGPIFIPPQTSAHMSRLRSPRVWNAMECGKETKIPPYTPPPMLSPQRKGSGLFNSVCHFNNRTSGNLSSTIYQYGTPLSTNVVTAISNGTCNNSVVFSSILGGQQISTAIACSSSDNKVNETWFDHNDNSVACAPRNGEPEHFVYHEESLDCLPQSIEDTDGLPTSATPRINIGSKYQAQVPIYRSDRQRSQEDYNRDWDVLLWDPSQFKDTVENISSLDLLMKIASSPAIKSCGLNMEYTFHLLCKFKGDLEKTLQALLEDSFVVYDYVYAETTNWTTEEINKFQERLKKRDRDFMQVATDLQECGMNKSVKACVEFYYVWKQMNNVKDINRYRPKTFRRKPINHNYSVIDNGLDATNHDAIVSGQPIIESGYFLRKKNSSGNQKLHLQYPSYDCKTSSEGSSREPSPTHYKPTKITAVSNREHSSRRLPSYHCPQCKRRFVKSKTLENHLRTHQSSSLIRDRVTLR